MPPIGIFSFITQAVIRSGRAKTYEVTRQVSVPANVSQGNQYLLFLVDGNDVQAETDEEERIFFVMPLTLTAADVAPNSLERACGSHRRRPSTDHVDSGQCRNPRRHG